jgi:hypothetical protein
MRRPTARGIHRAQPLDPIAARRVRVACVRQQLADDEHVQGAGDLAARMAMRDPAGEVRVLDERRVTGSVVDETDRQDAHEAALALVAFAITTLHRWRGAAAWVRASSRGRRRRHASAHPGCSRR